MDNYGTHKVAKVRGWLTRHPRYHVHFTPTSGSWLNLVEQLFCEVTNDASGVAATPPFARLRKLCSTTWTGATRTRSPSSGLPMQI